MDCFASLAMTWRHRYQRLARRRAGIAARVNEAAASPAVSM
jgi:hypothetical protein